MQLRLLRADLDHDLHGLAPGASSAQEQERMSIAVNADSIATWALTALTPLVAGGLPLEIIADDQDFTQVWLREGQVLGCVTALPQALRGCKAVPLGVMRYVAVASPAYAAARAPLGLTAHTARAMAFIAFNRKDELQARFVRKACRLQGLVLNQRFVPSAEGQVQAVLAGWGASVVPELKVRHLLDSGALVNLSPGTVLPVNLYWHCWNLNSGVLDALTRALTDAAAKALAPG
jgi:LysR family transcriptional regulator (chromosome initiation inhibitor)